MESASETFVSSTAIVEESVSLDEGCQIWHFSHLRIGCTLGKGVTIGERVYVDKKVTIGDFSKIQNGAQIYFPTIIGNGVFVGPNVIFTNDKYPRAVNQDGSRKSYEDWEPRGTIVEDYASIGAGAICISPIRIGRGSIVAAGAVVTKDVPPFSIVAGCPARVVGDSQAIW